MGKCENFCDDVCGSNESNAADKCKKPCNYINCNSGGEDPRGIRCFDTSDCPSYQYCKFFDGDCNPNHKASFRGRCMDFDKICTTERSPVCGCDYLSTATCARPRATACRSTTLDLVAKADVPPKTLAAAAAATETACPGTTASPSSGSAQPRTGRGSVPKSL